MVNLSLSLCQFSVLFEVFSHGGLISLMLLFKSVYYKILNVKFSQFSNCTLKLSICTVYWWRLWPTWRIYLLPGCSLSNPAGMDKPSSWSVLQHADQRNSSASHRWTSAAVAWSQPPWTETSQCSNLPPTRRHTRWTTVETWPGVSSSNIIFGLLAHEFPFMFLLWADC